jgi:hypothetical protein
MIIQIREDTMKSRIDYNYAHFEFDYVWLRDKQIVINGNEYVGILIILDKNGNALKWYGYELISDYEKE